MNERVLREFRLACDANDRAALSRLLAADVTAVSDGGGRVTVPAGPVTGRADVASLVLGALGSCPGSTLVEQPVNGRGGLVLRQAGDVVGVASLKIAGDEVTDVWLVLNPDKLRGWNAG